MLFINRECSQLQFSSNHPSNLLSRDLSLKATENSYMCHQFYNVIVLYRNAEELPMSLNSFQHFAIVAYFF